MDTKDPCPTCPKDMVITPELVDQMVQARRASGEVLADDDTYARRLDICKACEHHLNGGLCRLCGAFVSYRALERGGYCPLPSGNRWQD